MKYSLKEIRNSLTKKKNSRSSFWVKLWVRKASFPITYLFINTGWSANDVSILSWLIIFVGAICLAINSFYFMLVGVILTNLWLVLDCVDGNIARVKKKETYMGDFFDAIAGYGPFAFTTIGISVAAYNTSQILQNNEYRYVLLIIGGVGAMANLYTRLIHQKYLNCYFVGKNRIHDSESITLKDTEDKKSLAYKREQIDKNFGVAGLFMPWLFIALFTNTFDIMLIVYAVYYVASFIAVCFLYCKKATTFEKEMQIKTNNI